MIILTIRTDKPESELRLFDNQTQLTEIVWQAHRELAETIHLKMNELLDGQQKALKDIEGIVAFQGPGSFTGLRIGLSVANTLSDGLDVPIVASKGNDWQQAGIERLLKGEHDQLAMPEYGVPVHITQQKH
jgi:tRNA threonylcarbamoyladenosine biosynthesis protein TsaB